MGSARRLHVINEYSAVGMLLLCRDRFAICLADEAPELDHTSWVIFLASVCNSRALVRRAASRMDCDHSGIETCVLDAHQRSRV